MTVSDAEKFLKENYDLIKNQSLEGCPSALVWLPESSDIWKTYGSRVHSPWQLCLGRRKAWSMSELVLSHSESIITAVFSPDGMHVVTASDDRTAKIWNTATGECETELEGHSMPVMSAVFSPDGKDILTASYDETARIWNTSTGVCKMELEGHLDKVCSAVFSPDGMHIVTASKDDTARIWNTASGLCEAELQGHLDCVGSAIFSPDGKHIASASFDNTVWIWNSVTGKCEARLRGHKSSVLFVAFSPDSMNIASASGDQTARIWNMATRQHDIELQGHSNFVTSAVFSLDGMHVVSASIDNTARIWNTVTGVCETVLKGHIDLEFLGVSPDGMHIASISASLDVEDKRTAYIWNTTTEICEAELKGHEGTIWTAVFSPDGMHIVTGSNDQTARIWTVTGECEAVLKVHAVLKSADFSPNSQHVMTVSYNRTAWIWNRVTGECEVELYDVYSAVFSTDGLHIVAASSDHTAWIWNTVTRECEAKLNLSYMSENTQLSATGVFIRNIGKAGIALSRQPSFLDTYEDTIFHTRNHQKISIPHPFCKPVCISYHLSKICLGYGSGEILVLEVCILLKSHSTLLSDLLMFLNIVPGLTL